MTTSGTHDCRGRDVLGRDFVLPHPFALSAKAEVQVLFPSISWYGNSILFQSVGISGSSHQYEQSSSNSSLQVFYRRHGRGTRATRTPQATTPRLRWGRVSCSDARSERLCCSRSLQGLILEKAARRNRNRQPSFRSETKARVIRGGRHKPSSQWVAIDLTPLVVSTIQ